MAELNIPANDPLALSQVDAFFDRLYPSAGGIAIEGFDSTDVTLPPSTNNWNGGTTELYGDTRVQYTGTGGSQEIPGFSQANGRLTHNDTGGIPFRRARIDVDIEFTGVPATGTSPRFLMTYGDSLASGFIFAITRDIFQDGVYTYSDTSPDNLPADGLWNETVPLTMRLFNTVGTGFSFRILSLRLSFTQDEFVRYRPNGVQLTSFPAQTTIATNAISWPAGNAADVLIRGYQNQAWAYSSSPTGDGNNNSVAGSLRNDTGFDIHLDSTARMDMVVNISNNVNSVPASFRMLNPTDQIVFQSNVPIPQGNAGNGRYMIRGLNRLPTQDVWARDEIWRFILLAVPNGAFTYTIESLTISFDGRDLRADGFSELDGYLRNGGLVPSVENTQGHTIRDLAGQALNYTLITGSVPNPNAIIRLGPDAASINYTSTTWPTDNDQYYFNFNDLHVDTNALATSLGLGALPAGGSTTVLTTPINFAMWFDHENYGVYPCNLVGSRNNPGAGGDLYLRFIASEIVESAGNLPDVTRIANTPMQLDVRPVNEHIPRVLPLNLSDLRGVDDGN